MSKKDCILESLSNGLKPREVVEVCNTTLRYVRNVMYKGAYEYTKNYNRNLIEFGRMTHKSIRRDVNPEHYIEVVMTGSLDALPIVYDNGRVYVNPEMYFREVLSN